MKRSKVQGPTFVVLGGAGMMGRITVRDLVETAPPEVDILIADYNEAAARKLARSFTGRKVRAAFADVHDIRGTTKVLRGAFVVINAVQHEHNLAVMGAAAAAGCHYIDLGGLFHVTKKQLKLTAAFKKKKLLALLGMGAAPGIVNVLARQAADAMQQVEAIHIAIGNCDHTPGRVPPLLGASYSLQTIMDECTMPAALFTGGKMTFVEALSGEVGIQFPRPVGLCHPACTLHSEVATLPVSYKRKGIREVSFRIAFAPDFVAKLRLLRGLGLLDTEPRRVGKARVVPRQLLSALVAELPPGAPGGAPDEYEILRVVVRGTRDGVPVQVTLDCHTPGMPDWQLGLDVNTGCPPSIAAQMLWRGEITARGALPPERAVPVETFVKELAKRRMTVHQKEEAPTARHAAVV